MIDEKINKTLSELEANLRNVESARKQVESTVNSYEGLKDATANYVKSLSSIEDYLKELIKAIGKDYEKTTTSCNSLISKINDAVDDIKGEVSSQIEKFHKKFMYIIICNVIVWVTMLILFFINK